MGIKLNTAKQAFPMIYAYSTPQIADHNGWTKIGYTEEQDVETRIKQQTHTSDTLAKLEWKGAAIFDDGSGESSRTRRFTPTFASWAWRTRRGRSGSISTVPRDAAGSMIFALTVAF